MNNQTHWRNLMADNKYLGAWDLEVNGKYEPRVVTIEKVYQDTFVGEMGKEQKVFIKLKEFSKPMVTNRTNFKRLEVFFNSFNPDDYTGKQIVLGAEKVKSPQGMVEALRFSTRPLPAKKDEMKVLTDSSLKVAIEAVKTKSTSLDKIKSQYKLTPDQLKQLEDAQA
jgi:hypothetical protein